MKYSGRTFFVYEADYDATLGPSDTVNLTFNTQGDSDFFWMKLAVFALVSDTATTRDGDQIPAVFASVTNVTTGRSFAANVNINNGQINPFTLENVADYKQFLPRMAVWPRKSTIQVYLTNFDIGPGDTSYSSLQLSFIGIKAFP